MSRAETVALVSGGLAVDVTVVWYEDYLPYAWDWTRWQEHAFDCAQCAHHLEHVAAMHVYTPDPCPAGAEMLADMRRSMDSQRAEALAN